MRLIDADTLKKSISMYSINKFLAFRGIEEKNE